MLKENVINKYFICYSFHARTTHQGSLHTPQPPIKMPTYKLITNNCIAIRVLKYKTVKTLT